MDVNSFKFADLPEKMVLTGETTSALQRNNHPVNGNNRTWRVGDIYRKSSDESNMIRGNTSTVSFRQRDIRFLFILFTEF